MLYYALSQHSKRLIYRCRYNMWTLFRRLRVLCVNARPINEPLADSTQSVQPLLRGAEGPVKVTTQAVFDPLHSVLASFVCGC